MIGAVVVRPGTRPDAQAPMRAAAGRMRHQLARSGAVPRLVTGYDSTAGALCDLADTLEAADSDVVVAAADLVAHDEALADLLRDPRPRTAALLGQAGAVPSPARVRLRSGRIVDASSAEHHSDGELAFTGVLRVSSTDRPVAAAAAREMAETSQRHRWTADPVDLLLVALVRRELPVGAVSLDPWPWSRGEPAETQELRERLAGLDAHRIRLRRAAKADDGFWATLAIRPLSRHLTPLALRAGLTPNQVTVLSFVIGLAAAACFAAGDRLAGAVGVLGAVLLQLSLVVDCVDGEVARYTRTFTPLGAWLDASTDRVKEFACYAGLALGAGGGATVWLLAGAMLTLQTTRHTTDYTFTAVKDLRDTALERVPLDQATLTPTTPSSRAARAVDASERSNARSAVKWAKRVVHMGIGERWLVISVCAALGWPRTALVALLFLGVLSLAYTSVGRTLRARSWSRGPASDREREIVAAQLDPGPVALTAAAAVPSLHDPARLNGRFLWTLPPALRLVEYAAVLLLTWVVEPAATVAAFAMLFAVAFHHYDDLYGVLNRLAQPFPKLRRLGLGVDGRVLLVAVLGLLGATVLRPGLWVAAAALAALFVGYAVLRVWVEVRSVPRGRHTAAAHV